ncbi:glycosyltransferase family 61 protein [Hymenobacter busanensis]|uniref:Glycosyltransferase family 61 protein n=1 Tax=Hymenobacter busanensis TaxID=2607656 RepID=A0A7L5A0Z2_9BACT|nr:glycosyltransferase family 61 protein [Hymenobacter busanensis]KAA9332273.1 glycosyltransferase family 61 protein [Hymenobacter busanensis]QHJ07390.1 DUF563 domain-containing protein [Hymenobacter busanensis]
MSLLKGLLKKLLPIVLLKQAHLRYNQLRIRTVDKLLFPERSFVQADFVIRHDAYPFQLIHVEQAHLDARLQRQFTTNAQEWTQDEYLLVYDQPCLIEPQFGWAMSEDNQLIYPSLGFSRVPYLPKPALQAKRMHAAATEYAELVSLRDTGEENYFHFYNDVLAKLFFLEEKLQLSPNVPILVSEGLYKRAFFQYFLQHPYLSQRTWIVQKPTDYIRSRKTYFCKPLTHTGHYYKRITELVQPADLALSPTNSERQIFITRSPKRLRFIENSAEAEQICRELGFEVVDFDDMTLPEQIRTMANARYVVGIHGAGLTNMLFRQGRRMGLIEIYPPADYFPFHYVLMATQLGFAYDGLIGKPSAQKYSGGFLIDPAELRQRLQWLLAQ